MADKKVPFYTKTAVLDKYIKSSNTSEDPEALAVILESIRSNHDLHNHFFRSGPNPAWIKILWDNGFFKNPPPPIKFGDNYSPSIWLEQEFLISAADQFPDLVLKHIESIEGDDYYKYRAIEALCLIGSEKAEAAIPRLEQWIKKPKVDFRIATSAFKFIKFLAKDGKTSSAMNLFRILTIPLPPPDAKKVEGIDILLNTEAISKFDRSIIDNEFQQVIELLVDLDPQQTTAIIEEHLCTALKLEGEAKNMSNYDKSSYWRNAIEETNQDFSSYHRDTLLIGLRNALERWARKSSEKLLPFVERYLKEEREILRRLGFHILNQFPDKFPTQISRELLKAENINDIGIHHEFFMLLQKGYQYLNPSDQKALVSIILDGPPEKRDEEKAKWIHDEYGTDSKKYKEQYSKRWIRDRLHMIKDHIADDALNNYDKLVEELGKPEKPDFIVWSPGAYFEQDVSPVEEHELADMSPERLVKFVQNWQPDPRKQFNRERESYEGFANAVAKVVLDNLEKFEKQFTQIGLHRAEFAYSFFEQMKKIEEISPLVWDLSVSLCERILEEDSKRNDIDGKQSGNWLWARKRIVSFLQDRLEKKGMIPLEYLLRIKNILKILVNDPDPGAEQDQPAKGWFGHNDPATVAINHVRPEALSTLINYSLYKLPEEVKKERPGPPRFDSDVKDVLTKKLDKKEDPSWAVHSIFGKHLWLLYWMDKKWVESHIDQIFPEEKDEVSMRFFVAAWDSFVIFNHFNIPMLNILYKKYDHAIDNLGKGYTTETHLNPESSLANHLILEYFLSDKDIFGSQEKQPLIVKFFEKVKSEHRGRACWVLWKLIEENPSERKKYWSKVRALWEWRVNIATSMNNPDDFDDEMEWLAHLPALAPSPETISSLCYILEGMLPHITRGEHRIGWNAIEEYLAKEVEREPENTIEYYYHMREKCEKSGEPFFIYHDEKARKIIETAASNKGSREKALYLIDLLARSGIHSYRDIYDRYAN